MYISSEMRQQSGIFPFTQKNTLTFIILRAVSLFIKNASLIIFSVNDIEQLFSP